MRGSGGLRGLKVGSCICEGQSLVIDFAYIPSAIVLEMEMCDLVP
jgi:hypothetical protein